MRRFKRLGCGLCVVGLGCSQVEDPSALQGEFDALTYNVHGLPSQITGDDTPGRMVQIAPLLEAFDVIGLQEDFDDNNHEVLVSDASFDTKLWFSETVEEDRVYGSGLSVLARQPLVEGLHEHYTDCNGVFDGASDCLASKGFQVVRLQVGPEADQTLDVYNTHLEAGNGLEDDRARTAHVTQLLAALSGFSEGRAVLFLADTNLKDSDPEDLIEITRLLEQANLVELCVEVGCPEPGRIDRLLYRSSPSLSLTGVDWWVDERFEDSEGGPLSDHDPIAGRFGWTVQ